MGNFAMGLVTWFLGVLFVIVASVLAAIVIGGSVEDMTEEPGIFYLLGYIRFLMMIVGPAVFWVVLPILNRMMRRGHS